MKKKKFRIGELAEKLTLERFVIRFWEKEFGLSSTRSDGGQRFYDENDLTVFSQIKKLLYDEGFTIHGAKKRLSHLLKNPSNPTTKKPRFARKTDWDEEIFSQIGTLKKQLHKLRELL